MALVIVSSGAAGILAAFLDYAGSGGNYPQPSAVGRTLAFRTRKNRGITGSDQAVH